MFGQQKIGHIPINATSATSTGVGYGYVIEQSCLFNIADSPYLVKTFSSAGNRRTWTWSGWVKNSTPGTPTYLFSGTVVPYGGIAFQTDDTLTVTFDIGGPYSLHTNAIFHDFSSWMHVVVAVDTTQIVQEERIKVWVDGIRYDLSIRTGSWPPLNTQGSINNNTQHDIGSLTDTHRLFHGGLMADVNFIDGQALGPEYFGAFNSDDVWIPINPANVISEYGQNGFRMTFSDSAELGADSAPLTAGHVAANSFTASGLSASDQRHDVPTIDEANSLGAASTLNVFDLAGDTANIVLSENNSKFVKNSAGYGHVRSTFALPAEEKVAFAYTYTGVTGGTLPVVGIAADDGSWKSMSNANVFPVQITKTFTVTSDGGTAKDNVAGTSYTAAAAGYVGYCAIDTVLGYVWFGIDTGAGVTWFGGGNPTAGTSPTFTGFDNSLTWHVASSSYQGEGLEFDFANEDNLLPSGFLPLNSNALQVSIAKSNHFFDVVRYVGNGAQRQISDLNFRPDLVWIKNRDQIDSHQIIDSVRGAFNSLAPDDVTAEATNTNGLLAFNSNGFTLGTGAGGYNDSGESFVAWCWNAGDGAPIQNNAGTIESLVKTNPISGFSIVSYTGNGVSGATIGHGLGNIPEFFIVKNRTTTSRSWLVYHDHAIASAETGAMILDGTLGYTLATSYWNDTEPTATVFSVGNNGQCNTATDEYIGYFWKSIPGFSKFYKYTGNGSSSGPFVYTGFRPAFIMVKRADSTSSWAIIDDERMPSNGATYNLFADTTAAETTGVSDLIEFTSTGFRPIGTGNAYNSVGTYVYAAFAAQSLKFVNGR